MKDSPTLRWQTGLPRDVLTALTRSFPKRTPSDEDVLDWMLGEGRLQPEVRRYLSYLKVLAEHYSATAELFDLWSPRDSAGTKQALRLTHPWEMLYLANHLYVLDSYEVPGVLLECGCAHGFSTVCLSEACRRLGRTLVVADSFAGLPPPNPEEPFFREGDYAASEEEVRHHLQLAGAPEVVEFVKGWYSQSLSGWNRPVALLWMDVDLYESARDLLAHVLPNLDRRGAIFTHEFTDFDGTPHPPGSSTVPGALYEAFAAAGIAPRTALVTRYWGIFAFPSSLQAGSAAMLDGIRSRLAQLDSRWRAWDELRTSRTVRTAFAAKRLLMPWTRGR